MQGEQGPDSTKQSKAVGKLIQINVPIFTLRYTHKESLGITQPYRHFVLRVENIEG